MDQVAVSPVQLCMFAFSLVFMAYSRTQSFQENCLFILQDFVVLKPLVSLIGHLVACSARISVDTHTQRQTDRQTDKPTTVTLAVHARRGLIKSCQWFKDIILSYFCSQDIEEMVPDATKEKVQC